MTDEQGTYIFVFLSEDTKNGIMEYVQEANIPNPLRKQDLHCTLLYDRNEIKEFRPMCVYGKPLIGRNIRIGMVQTLTGNNCLVLYFDCDSLDRIHEFIRNEYQATHYFPEYNCHVTVSYDIGDLDIKKLPDITSYVNKIIITGECSSSCQWYNKEETNGSSD